MNRNFKTSSLIVPLILVTVLIHAVTHLDAATVDEKQHDHDTEELRDRSVPKTVLSMHDKKHPLIYVHDMSDDITVYTDKIYIAGKVLDDGIVKSVTLNNGPENTDQEKSILFSRLVDLKEGNNTIKIAAEDRAGNTTTKEITVIMKNMKLSKLPAEVMDKRTRLAVYPFDQKGKYSEKSRYFQDLLTLSLQEQKRFNLVDRKIMTRILEEQDISTSELVDRSTAIKAGKLMSAQAIITGSISETERGIEIVGRMIDTETSKILVTEKIYSTTDGLSALEFLAESMVIKLINDMPMFQGTVIKLDKDQIFTDLGQDKIALHGRLIIYRDISPDAAAIAEGDSIILGHARVTQVFRDMSKAVIIWARKKEIKELDKVIIP